MHRRLLAIGLLTTFVGLAGLAGLVIGGVVQHPVTAAAEYGPAEFVSIGASFLAVTVGVVVTFRSLVVFPDAER